MVFYHPAGESTIKLSYPPCSPSLPYKHQ